MRSVVAVVALISCVHAGLWAFLYQQQSVPNIDGPLASVSYSPYTRWQDPERGDRPTVEQIRSDLRLLSPYTRTIRTYTSTRGLEVVPALAAAFGTKATLGTWPERLRYNKTKEATEEKRERNEREIQQAIALAKRYSNVNAIVVGNESVLRDEVDVDDLIEIIKRVKRQVPVPVTTGETWDVWTGDNKEVGPEQAAKLASAVDFIAA